MKRNTALAVIAIYAVMLIAAALTPAYAQELTDKDITYDSACGAPGVGRRGTLGGNPRLERKQAPGWRVNSAGRWIMCDMPPDCPEQPSPYWVGRTGRVCESPRTLPGRDVGRRVELSTGYGKLRGYATMLCARREDGSYAWVMEKSTCEPTPQSMLRPEDRRQ